MAIENTDLLLVQRGNQPYRETVDNLSTKIRGDIDVSSPSGDIPIASASQLGVIRVGDNLDIDAATGILSAVIPAGLTYKGTWNDANNPPTPAANGDFYIWDGGNATLNNALWGTSNGNDVVDGDRLFYDGTTWAVVGGGSGGLTEITGTAPVVVTAVADGEQDVSMPKATDSNDGYMPKEAFAKLDGIDAGAEVNVDPTQTFTPAADSGTLTLSPGGDTTVVPVATDTLAGLMSAADKAQLDSLVATPGGVASLNARNGITNNGTATAPILDVDFGALPNGDPATAEVMPYDISALAALP